MSHKNIEILCRRHGSVELTVHVPLILRTDWVWVTHGMLKIFNGQKFE